MSEAPKPKAPIKNDEKNNKICGIVMPISHMPDDYTEIHWSRVRKIIEKAILTAGFEAKVVWDNPDLDVIQSKILQNIYDNEVIICDLSNLNPNVMLEAGLRLSTKKPTILITDGEKKPPFDVSSVEYLSYQRNLEYNSIEAFINTLSKKIISVSESYRADKYKSFVESYQIEIATPTKIQVSGEQYILNQLNDIKKILASNFPNSDINNIDKPRENKLGFLFHYSFQYNGPKDEFLNIIEYLDKKDCISKFLILSTNDKNTFGTITIKFKSKSDLSDTKSLLSLKGIELID